MYNINLIFYNKEDPVQEEKKRPVLNSSEEESLENLPLFSREQIQEMISYLNDHPGEIPADMKNLVETYSLLNNLRLVSNEKISEYVNLGLEQTEKSIFRLWLERIVLTKQERKSILEKEAMSFQIKNDEIRSKMWEVERSRASAEQTLSSAKEQAKKIITQAEEEAAKLIGAAQDKVSEIKSAVGQEETKLEKLKELKENLSKNDPIKQFMDLQNHALEEKDRMIKDILATSDEIELRIGDKNSSDQEYCNLRLRQTLDYFGASVLSKLEVFEQKFGLLNAKSVAIHLAMRMRKLEATEKYLQYRYQKFTGELLCKVLTLYTLDHDLRISDVELRFKKIFQSLLKAAEPEKLETDRIGKMIEIAEKEFQ